MGDDQRPAAPQLEAPTLGRLFGRRKDRSGAPPKTPADPVGAPVDSSAALPAPALPEAPTAPADWASVEEPSPAQVEETTLLDHPVASGPAQVTTPAPAPAASVPPAPAPAVSVPPAPAPVADLGPLVAAGTAGTEPRAARVSRPTLTVSGRVAAGVSGLVIGLLALVLIAGSLALCESVRGVSSCGGGPGFALLLAVTAAMITLGGLMLRLAGVPDPTSTSFLAVGLLCVLSLLFLLDVLDEWWMILIIPALSTATFLLSHWVTTAVAEAD